MRHLEIRFKSLRAVIACSPLNLGGAWLATARRRLHLHPMTVEHIRELLHKNAPLIVHVMSGREFRIPQGDFAHISQSQNYLVFSNEDDTLECIRLPAIESITVQVAGKS